MFSCKSGSPELLMEEELATMIYPFNTNFSNFYRLTNFQNLESSEDWENPLEKVNPVHLPVYFYFFPGLPVFILICII